MQKIWPKDGLLRRLLQHYEKDVEPPVNYGGNTTVQMSLNVLCSSGHYGHVMIDAWARMVSRRDAKNTLFVLFYTVDLT